MTIEELNKYRVEIPNELNRAKVFLVQPDGSEIRLPNLVSVEVSQDLNQPGCATIRVIGAFTTK